MSAPSTAFRGWWMTDFRVGDRVHRIVDSTWKGTVVDQTPAGTVFVDFGAEGRRWVPPENISPISAVDQLAELAE